MKKYALRERDISYKSGLLIKKITTVPFSRIQHVEIDEKPISRLFGLASLSVYTAGDSSDDLVVKGLKKEILSQSKNLCMSIYDISDSLRITSSHAAHNWDSLGPSS